MKRSWEALRFFPIRTVSEEGTDSREDQAKGSEEEAQPSELPFISPEITGKEESNLVSQHMAPPAGAADSTMYDDASIQQKIPLHVEVCLKPTSSAKHKDIRAAVEKLLERRGGVTYADGVIAMVPGEDTFLDANVDAIEIVDTDDNVAPRGVLLFWQLKPRIFIYQLNEEGAAEEIEGDDEIATYREFQLPAREFHGLWDSLVYDTGVKHRLLRYAASALLFADRKVNDQLVAWNRVVLLHGPPGTGKTSLCKSIAQKLAIKFSDRYAAAQLVEVNAHSLFSKWFSESGKLVTKLFQKIGELVEEEDSLVFVLIDEVESLTAARKAALSGAEPSDAIRVVNALLTQVDALKSRPNVMVLTTSNITDAIDIAFVDRADIKAYIGNPSVAARYAIFLSAFKELYRCGIVDGPPEDVPPSHKDLLALVQTPQQAGTPEAKRVAHAVTIGNELLDVCELCEGFSGRALRKLPFLAHATRIESPTCSSLEFIRALRFAVQREIQDRSNMGHEMSAGGNS